MGDILTGLVGWWKLDDQSSVPVTVNPPTNVVVNVVEDGSGNYFNDGYCFEYVVFGYKVVGPTTYYSSSVYSGVVCDSGFGGIAEHIDISWTAAAGVDGYKVLIRNDAFGASYDYSYTLAGTSFTDGNGTEASFIIDSDVYNHQTFADSSGISGTGTGTGNLTVGAVGLFGRATNFTPLAYILAPYTMPANDQSQGVWINVVDTGNHYVIDEGGNNHWIQVYSGHIRCGVRGDTGAFLDSNFVPTASTWIHLVTTYNRTSGTFKLYVNGTFDKSAVYAVNTPGTLTIGDNSGVGSTFQEFSGIMQDLRIYNRVLSQADIDLLYAYRGSTARRRSSVVLAE